MEHESAPSARRRELQKLLVVACAIAHGEGSGQSLSDLVALVLERGLPAREERERLRDERLAEDAGENAHYGPGNPDWERDFDRTQDGAGPGDNT